MARVTSTQLLNLREKFDPTIASLIKIHSIDAGLFFALSMEEIEDSAEDPWIKPLSELAHKLRQMIIRGFEIRRRNDVELELRGGGETVAFDNALEPTVAGFVRLLNGVSMDGTGRDYRGSAISEREMLFGLGDPSEWEADNARLQASSQIAPQVLQIADDDKDALLSGTPAYAIYSLQRLVPRVLAAPQAVYRGLRQSGRLANGFAFCGHPKHALGNRGEVIQAALNDMIFVVYADEEGYVFDWDWVTVETDDSSAPDHTKQRFRERLESHPPAVLVGMNDLRPGNFIPKAWWSRRGDCVFYYISDAPSFAQRINDDLTVFWGFADNAKMTGCKVKNIARFLKNSEANRFQRKQGHLPLAYFLGRSLSNQALNGHTRHYGELVQNAEQSGTEVQIEMPTEPEHAQAGG